MLFQEDESYFNEGQGEQAVARKGTLMYPYSNEFTQNFIRKDISVQHIAYKYVRYCEANEYSLHSMLTLNLGSNTKDHIPETVH